ncbi:hypothetical protein B0H17DRAFT_1221163 [Mycena rosella]|uniref:Uncharacterized protein n=1 Tax=Mycena rosella TaxID=1033263 RepID=A0AAD7FC34_MYCRO|nr:hypothetical protein B0H17DRAFT_1221163 [Mycena rosella]
MEENGSEGLDAVVDHERDGWFQGADWHRVTFPPFAVFPDSVLHPRRPASSTLPPSTERASGSVTPLRFAGVRGAESASPCAVSPPSSAPLPPLPSSHARPQRSLTLPSQIQVHVDHMHRGRVRSPGCKTVTPAAVGIRVRYAAAHRSLPLSRGPIPVPVPVPVPSSPGSAPPSPAPIIMPVPVSSAASSIPSPPFSSSSANVLVPLQPPANSRSPRAPP